MTITVLFAFAAGLIAAFNPCGAAMFPAYVGFQLSKRQESQNFFKVILNGLNLGLFVTLGFISVFGVFGLIFALGGTFLTTALPIIGLLVGIIVIVTGIFLIISRKNLVFKLPFSQMGNLNTSKQTFLFGVAYALASLSCALPVFLAAIGVVIGTGLNTSSVLNILIGTLSYSMGMGLIMTGVTLSVLFFEDATSRMVNRIIPLFSLVGKLAMIFGGIYIVWYWALGSGRELLALRIVELF
jgi:cytochrome c biogenesis protein CcdA